MIEVKEDCYSNIDKQHEVVMTDVSKPVGVSNSGVTLDCIEILNDKYNEFFSQCQQSLNSRFSFSSSTIAWLEMIIVDVSLRNRDRFTIIWPILKNYYLKVLSGSCVKLSYIAERRIVGLMKICTRMLSREHYCGEILDVMGKVFARTTHAEHIPNIITNTITASPSTVELESELNSNTNDTCPPSTISKQHTFHPMSNALLMQFSNQVRTCDCQQLLAKMHTSQR